MLLGRNLVSLWASATPPLRLVVCFVAAARLFQGHEPTHHQLPLHGAIYVFSNDAKDVDDDDGGGGGGRALLLLAGWTTFTC